MRDTRLIYYCLMKKKLIFALAALSLTVPLLSARAQEAQTPGSVNAPGTSPSTLALTEAKSSDEVPDQSALGSELFYQLLLGEISAREGEPSAGFALMLDAARKTNDAQLYQRATEMALQSRSGDAALQAAKAWQLAQPEAREPNRFLLQILITLNRISETSAPLKANLLLTPAAERAFAINSIPAAYARTNDKKIAASLVQQALLPYLADPVTAGPAWTTVSRMQLAAGDLVSALQAAQRAQSAQPDSPGPALIGLELMSSITAPAETLVKNYFENQPKAPADVRMGYVRVLLDAQRIAQATAQLQIVIQQQPKFASAWLVLGSLQLQQDLSSQAQTSLEQYVALAEQQTKADQNERGMTSAYLSLAQIAEKRKDFAAAQAWIDKIDNADDLLQAQLRSASILAAQGKIEQARKLLRNIPETKPDDARLKIMAEVSLLRDFKKYQLAYDLLDQTAVKFPNEPDLLYEQAMMAEKNSDMQAMERLLRLVIKLKPDYYSAYNALGYSFADRNVNLPEAKALIQKALQYVPDDPFISDSLGWVEYRIGNKAEAERILAKAYKARPDPEIAAHYGEVLWESGKQEKAKAIWREGQLLNPDNETLVETLLRLRVKL
jgi:tetratricopeptide (TPR) repeat protein